MERRDLLRLEVPFGLLGAAMIAAAVAFAALGTPERLPSAPLVALGGVSPLSGMTRSFVALVSGDASAAFAWHPLGPLVFAAAVVAPVVAAVSLLRGRRFGVTALLRSRPLWAVVGAAFAAAWLRQLVVL